VRPSLRRPGPRGTNRHDFRSDPAQTRAKWAGIVSREGGGTIVPTLGGGYGVGGRAGAAEGGAPS
jgi:hypothetical protein